MDTIKKKCGPRKSADSETAGGGSDAPEISASLRDALYRSLLENSIDAVYLLSEEGRVLDVNRVACAMTGYSREELLGLTIDDLDPNYPSKGFVEFWNAKPEGATVLFESLHRRKDGTLVPVEVNGIFTKVQGRKFLFGVARDISERKRAERTLRESETKYRTLVDILPVGVTITDANGKILETNRMSERILGLSRQDHARRRIDGREWRIVRTDGSPMPPEEYASTRALREGRLVEGVEMGIQKEDGETTWLTVNSAPLPLEGYGVAVAYSDISASRRSEEHIRSLLREKEILLKETHHRVKNNLQTILSLLALQMDEVSAPESLARLRDLSGRVRSMLVLYNKLYDSGDFGRLDLREYLGPLVREILGIFPPIPPVRLEAEVDGVFLDARTLSSLGIILNEWTTNSMKYAFAGLPEGVIRISARQEGPQVVCAYEDNGPGIPEGAGGPGNGGFGMRLIGLLAEQMGGDCRREGARWTLRFPADTSDGRKAAPPT